MCEHDKWHFTKQARNDYQINVSSKTIKRRLHEVGLQGRWAKKKPLLSTKYIAKWLQLAKKHETWTTKNWKRVMWSDRNIKIKLISRFICRKITAFIWRFPELINLIILIYPNASSVGIILEMVWMEWFVIIRDYSWNT